MIAIMVFTNITVVSVEGKDVKQTTVKITVTLKIKNKKKVLHLLPRGKVTTWTCY